MSEYDARLTDRVRTRGVLGPDDAARLLLPVADSLASVHGVAGAHGAVSPDAVLVDASGRATLVDSTRAVPLAAYAPPDPSQGLRAHPAADDVWAFGAVLRFVTTGEAPGQPAPPARDSGWLGPIIELALHPSPRERPTMADVADYLRPRGAAAPVAPRRSVSGSTMALVGGGVIAALALLGAFLLFSDQGDDEPDTAADDAVSAPRSTTQDPDDRPTATASAQPVDGDELEDFARDYIATASRDPDRGFQLLTREYQEQSPRYREVWSAIEDPEVLSVTSDAATLSVSYVYRYRLSGNGVRTEDVTLRLVEQDGQLLIAGASARQL
ncbi:hypothetical protein ACFQ0K_13460 [Nocardioides caeni]|uniref:Protein kinase domain-containing protein n=1 Tax=Nocardioides caeni TaxID=574700 RepID=A0A4S8N009_9ACTN|nr:hypothetical protein [Nocardioides caeni]THV08802.1 hypothetical protein E9934_19110 [Nocardioides caeni]